ncbi:uncharacterized protein LOC141536770 isoform X2 [Cotesia typhae]|uniref:uncharacterized protein LOC141536770 isoform X2 n=1 Tax=Cotesia typhae TaxID=2053667 RepID=UPI003D680B20
MLKKNKFVQNENSEETITDESLNCDRMGNEFVPEQQILIDTSDVHNNVDDIVEDQTSTNGFNIDPDENSSTFSLKIIINMLKDKALPFNWSRSRTFDDDTNIILFHIDSVLMKVKLKIVISTDFTIMITVVETGISVIYEHPISSVTDFWSLLRTIGKSQFCSGSGFLQKKCSDKCYGILDPHEEYKRYKIERRCLNCRNLRKKLLNSKRKNNCDKNKRYMTMKRKLQSKSKRLHRLQRKNVELRNEIEGLRGQCAMVKEQILEEEISHLPEAQKEAVRACFQAAKVKNKKQRRYTIEWVYECLMVRIKGPAVYEKLRTRQILPLPCTLLLDEIALSEAVKLNTKSMEFNGFVNLGEYTQIV